jgi:hypothetical protein
MQPKKETRTNLDWYMSHYLFLSEGIDTSYHSFLVCYILWKSSWPGFGNETLYWSSSLVDTIQIKQDVSCILNSTHKVGNEGDKTNITNLFPLVRCEYKNASKSIALLSSNNISSARIPLAGMSCIFNSKDSLRNRLIFVVQTNKPLPEESLLALFPSCCVDSWWDQ